MSGPWEDFDRWLTEHRIAPEDAPEVFAQFLANKTGQAIVAGPVGEAPTVVAIPDPEVRP